MEIKITVDGVEFNPENVTPENTTSAAPAAETETQAASEADVPSQN